MQDYRVEVDIVNEEEWSNLLLEFADATIYQTWSYGAVRWGENNLSHIIVKNNREVIGMAQVVIKKIPLVRAGIAYIPWGPLWQKKGNDSHDEHFLYILKALQGEYVVKRGLLLRMTPNVTVSDNTDNICSFLENEGFKKILSASCYRTFLVDLTPSLQDIRARLNPKWRNKLKGAEKNNLRIIEGSSGELYQIFLNLQKEMQERKEYVPGVDYDEFKEIQEALPNSLKMKIMVCEYEGEPIVATIVTAIGNTGIYLLGATGNKWLNLKGSYLIHWQMMRWLKEEGYQFYDLGGINPESNPGVYTFKAGFSGQDVCHIGEFEVCQNILSSQFVFLGGLLKNIIGRMKQ